MSRKLQVGKLAATPHLPVAPEVQHTEAQPDRAAGAALQQGQLADIAPREVPESD